MTISTRTPHAGSDFNVPLMPSWCPFQPALPMRGVTSPLAVNLHPPDISTRTPHAGSDEARDAPRQLRYISTRTPHAGSDSGRDSVEQARRISTRTPHAGSDLTASAPI